MKQEQIRNFVIISHVDHGKSTLADRLLEITKTVEKDRLKPQYLDMLELERERGVTIKMAPVRMFWKSFIFNLIDTPGHADFAYEVSRALKAVEGAVLLVDATTGVQAQTIAHLNLARKTHLSLIPVINKIDLPLANIERVTKEISELGFDPKEILQISAKTGQNVNRLLEAIISRFPPPLGSINQPLKALVFDSFYDLYKGVVTYVRVYEGKVRPNDRIKLLSAGFDAKVLEVGHFQPELAPSSELVAGEIGYLKTDLKDPQKIRIGDTITLFNCSDAISPIPGYQEPKPMVFATIYPLTGKDLGKLKNALLQLKLNDASLTFAPESSPVFGSGFKCGFLGVFHLEITKERLERDYQLDLVITQPTVDIKMLDNVYYEPYVRLEIVSPLHYLGKITDLAKQHRGEFESMKYLNQQIILTYRIPLSEIIIDFYEQLKSVSSGYASMDYQLIGYQKANLTPLEIIVAGEKVEPLSQIVPKDKALEIGRRLIKKLAQLLPRQLFEINLQAAVGGKIIARENIPPLRKNVTAPLYGGDVTRKKKLLEKQKLGKKKLKKLGRVEIPNDLFLQLLKR